MEIVELAKHWVERFVREGDLAIDATVGNGHDTRFLARLVGSEGTVFGLDVQEGALEATRGRLVADGLSERVQLLARSHTEMAAVLEEAGEERSPRAIMLNCGYLPGGDRRVTTQTPQTMEALEAALDLLMRGGVITIVLYPGHPEGQREAEAVAGWARELRSPFAATLCRPWNRSDAAPFLIAIEKP